MPRRAAVHGPYSILSRAWVTRAQLFKYALSHDVQPNTENAMDLNNDALWLAVASHKYTFQPLATRGYAVSADKRAAAQTRPSLMPLKATNMKFASVFSRYAASAFAPVSSPRIVLTKRARRALLHRRRHYFAKRVSGMYRITKRGKARPSRSLVTLLSKRVRRPKYTEVSKKHR